MKKYFEIAKINFMNNLVYFSEFLLKSLFILVILFIFINIWKAVYAGRELVEGFSLAMMIWYLLLAESIVTSGSTVVRELNTDIQGGGVAYQLNKPYSYIGYYFTKSISYKLIGFTVTFIVGSILVYSMLGGISFSFSNLPYLLLLIFLALILDFFMLLCIALLAFWFEDTTSFRWIYDKIMFTIGGMLIPLEIFPKWLANISNILPFSFAVYQPAKLFVDFTFDRFLHVLCLQLIYILVFLAIAILIYRKGIRRVNINGG
jgi:ABC-2 type transport system permease protein